MLVTTIVMTSVGLLLAPFMVLIGVDPISVFINYRFPDFSTNHFPIYLTFKVLDYLIHQFGTLESTRIYLTLFLPAMTLFQTYTNCLTNISNRKLNHTTISLYNQLYCINQVGVDFVKGISGFFLGIGIVLLAICNWIVIAGWGSFPLEIYMLVFGVSSVGYFLLTQTVPYAAKSNELSVRIQKSWEKQLLTKGSQICHWSKLIVAKRPISFYYAMTKFERDTFLNYLYTIVDYTINLLMLS